MIKTSNAQVRRGFSVVMLAVVVAAPASASWHGLVSFGSSTLGLSPVWAVVVPISLDGAALYAASLAMRAVLAGDSALTPRVLTVAYALASAGFNAQNAMRSGEGAAGALFFGGAAVSAALLWDVTLRALRRDQLRDLGLLEAPLPSFRLVRWVVAPVETSRAWRTAVLEGLTDADEALALVRAQRVHMISDRQLARSVSENNNTEDNDEGVVTDGDAERVECGSEGGFVGDVRGDRDGAVPDLHEAPGCSGGLGGDGRPQGGPGVGRAVDVRGAVERGLVEVAEAVRAGGLSKADAMRAAFDRVGRRDIPEALALLADAGLEVDRSYAYTVKWSPSSPSAPLHVVGGER